MIEFDRNRKLEFTKPEDIRKVQEALLRKHVHYAAEHSPFYRSLFKERGIDPGTVTLQNLGDLPLTDKSRAGPA